jgi:predicted Zn-dependent protease
MTETAACPIASIARGFTARVFWCLIFCLGMSARLPAQTNGVAKPSLTNNLLVMIQGTVEVARSGHPVWTRAVLNQKLFPGDRIRTGERSRAEVYLAGGMTIKKGELSEVEIPPSQGATFKRGLFEIFHRDKNHGFEYQLPSATAAIRGTDFLVKVDADGRGELTVLDGEVVLRNGTGEITISNNELGVAESNGALHKTAVLQAVNDLIQWSLYYPGVIDPDEPAFTSGERDEYKDSLAAYRAGDLLAAVASPNISWQTVPSSDAARVFRAALLLSVGQAGPARELLATAGDSSPARALEEMLAVTQGEKWERTNPPASAPEWLAESYGRQAQSRLEAALEAAQMATAKAPDFGFAWERVAELQFSSGRIDQALAALDRALQLSPRNAQGLALKGFLLAAQNKIPAALPWFEQAITVDSALGNAWLGRGLCLIRQGHSEAGRRDLLVAASLEPQRSVLRSYLGKAFADAGDDAHADRELLLARELDPRDPTAWLYSALLKQEQNRINQAVRDLQASQDRNDNRSLFRSRFLLDQDRAVGSANLAGIYRDAGMTEVSVDEAVQAVNDDYANYSAHLFLADSLNALRDPTRFNLRYETAWFNELLLANLYAPVGARPISQNISQQEYSRLFEQDRFGLDTDSNYRSDGQFREIASQYGSQGATSYSLDLDYQHNSGIRPNNELSSIEWYSQLKHQLGPYDTVMLFAKYEDYHSGDNFQYNNAANADPYFRYDESQTPLLVAAYHHEWGPGDHTLVMAGRLPTGQQITDQNGSYYLVPVINGANFYNVQNFSNLDYSSRLNIYTTELNQLLEWEAHTLILGTRYQFGRFTASDTLTPQAGLFAPVDSSIDERFERLSIYGYHQWELFTGFQFTTGLTYDRLTYPDNFRFSPVTPGTTRREQFSPKVALKWNVNSEITFRAAYARALGGASLDESFTLEPTQIGGFNQAFRSIISESLVGSLAGPRYDVGAAAFELKLKPQTYLTFQAQYLECASDEDIGVIDQPVTPAGPAAPGTIPEQLRYREPSAAVTFNQLWGDDWAMGLQYRYTESRLAYLYPTINTLANQRSLDQAEKAGLHQVNAYFQFTHPSGFYARAEAQSFFQQNRGGTPLAFDPAPANSDFAQVNLLAGWRFWHRRADASAGILNLGGGDYKLNPLNPYSELPRSRVFFGRMALSF